MKLYTRTGDKGTTSVIGGKVNKDDERVEAFGTIDELNAFVGQAAATAGTGAEKTADAANEPPGGIRAFQVRLLEELTVIQHELFDCGSDLSYAEPQPEQLKVKSELVERLEAWIDRHEAGNPPIARFILPGGTATAAALHVCRTVCRRAERAVVTLAATGRPCPPEVAKYLNRLSDYFFAAARAANAKAGVQDVEYERGAAVFRRIGKEL
ncbi:cob(I)yrinic acid a,c-diamide adenosyltransferase [Cohnella hashimotonis]|uniref:Corrinoid adenosyltransferase n=1 Tax=Cohnella hashimotonis TaxID=2826895 RepID=A0ABT6TDI9_9BACL|nr:cob(I)yrinic acid a,c-diamide adenosyltransferase [Cohnella hashimotonis]MDI4644641.1 cob(I)yrinic acid a,c-diamide adenosyltransferase [Cohnella hashimotonis]